MKVLLDTHSLVWALDRPEHLSKRAVRLIGAGEALVSVACLWELILKRGKKGALLLDPTAWWNERIVGGDFTVLGIHSKHVLALEHLPEIHGDPFDRILVAQCKVEGASLVTKDERMGRYGVPIIW